MVRLRQGSLQSTNWSGYAVNGSDGSVSLAFASWTVPSVACAGSGLSYAAAWVGIDGFQSSTVEQIGTDSDCALGTASYYAWYEFYPAASKLISGLTVTPGDQVAALVVYRNGAFTVAIRDVTTGLTFTSTSAVSGAQRSSAEFIVEAPLVCLLRCRLAPLADFGTMGFGADNTGVSLSCGLVMNGVAGPIGTFGSSVQRISMVSSSSPGTVKAQPSLLSSDGTSFTVQWLNAGP
jgi:Peptidase A4 family